MAVIRKAPGLVREGISARLHTLKLFEMSLKITTYLLLAAAAVATAMPFVWMITSSFKLNAEIYSYPLTLLPRNGTLSNYIRLLNGSDIPFIRQFGNSVLIAVSQTFLALFVSSLVGFGFAVYDFRFKAPLFVFVLATMMIPSQVTLVPLFLLMHTFGWLDTYQAIVVPGAISAFGVFFLRQTMLSIPHELLDAGRIDGCSEFGLYSRVGLPLSGAGLSVLAVLFFLGSWNNYLWPVIVLRTMEKFTVPLGLATLIGLYKQEWGMVLAGAFLATLPIFVLFILGRKQFVTGLTSGAVKG